MATVHMVYDGTTYDLPKYTLAIQDKMDEARETEDIRERIIKMREFVAFVLGDDFADNYVGTLIEEYDLIELHNLFIRIDQSYANAMRDMTGIDDTMEIVDRLGGMDNAIAILNAVNGK